MRALSAKSSSSPWSIFDVSTSMRRRRISSRASASDVRRQVGVDALDDLLRGIAQAVEALSVEGVVLRGGLERKLKPTHQG
jgi:hypothetical protein